MFTLTLDEVIVPEYRIRREFDVQRITELADDIAEHGLMHPIVVRRDDDGFKLIAGERRLRALTHLLASGKPHILIAGTPYKLPNICAALFSEVSPEQALEMELSENVIRINISWQERVAAIAKLDAIRSALAETSGEKYTPTDLSRSISGDAANAASNQTVRDAIVIAKHLDDPEVAAAKTQREAARILERKHKDILREELTARLSVSARVLDGEVIHGSAFDILPTMDAANFDIIITDPPYGIDANSMAPQGGSQSGVHHDYADDLAYAESCTMLLAQEGFRVTKPNACLYMFCDIKLWQRWCPFFANAGWYVWPVPLIWDKGSVGSLLGAISGPRHCYEAILFAVKGSRACKALSDVIKADSPKGDLHAAEKPVALYLDLLARLAVPGDRVLDPFCGSGPVFLAARVLHCYAVGIEKNVAHVHTSTLRLQGVHS